MATDFGQMIRHARHARGLRLEDLAERVGVTPGALSHIESGRRLPTPRNAVRIASELGIPEEVVMRALDEEHSLRRRDSVSADRDVADIASRKPGEPDTRVRMAASPAFAERPIEDLFGAGMPLSEPSYLSRPSPSAAAASMPFEPAPDSQHLRAQARWSADSNERIHALLGLADTASDAIRTLRGALEDEDPRIRHEARRLLRELDVRLPEE